MEGMFGEASSISRMVCSNDDFFVLCSYLEVTGLYDTLNDADTYTLFAATNAAFDQLTIGTSLTNDEIMGLLMYHVAPTVLLYEDLMRIAPGDVETIIPSLAISVSTGIDGEVLLNGGVKITTPDIEASNGYIQVIEEIIVPSTFSPCTTIEISITLDDYPTDTSWNIVHFTTDTVVKQSSPYEKSMAQTTQVDRVCLMDGSYTFVIFDAYEDGICCNWGEGKYILQDRSGGAGGGEIFVSGGEWIGPSDTRSFTITQGSASSSSSQSIPATPPTTPSTTTNKPTSSNPTNPPSSPPTPNPPTSNKMHLIRLQSIHDEKEGGRG
jgi:hypothetical protein